MGVPTLKASASCVTFPPKGNLVESTLCAAFKYGVLLSAYAALGVKFIPLPRYHSCGDYKHGAALPRLVGLGCSACNTSVMKVAVERRARRAVGGCVFGTW